MSLTLYYHPLASFCHKVLIALYENHTAFERRIINLAEPADRAELEAIWPLCRFPVVRDHARAVDVPETSIIIEYLDRHYPGAQPLLPTDPDVALDVRLWDRFFDHYVQEPMQSIVLARLNDIQCDQTSDRTKLKTAYKMIEKRMEAREWMCGASFRWLIVLLRRHCSTLLPCCLPQEYDALTTYFDRLMARPSVRACWKRPSLTSRCTRSTTIYRNVFCKERGARWCLRQQARRAC
jgi:glutathione S-transferase